MSKHPDDNTAAAELPWALLCFPFYTSLPFMHKKILVMSFYDVTIVCSIILVGKLLCMCRWTADGSSAYLQASTPINHLCWKYEMLSFHFQTRFHACDTLPQVFQCALVP